MTATADNTAKAPENGELYALIGLLDEEDEKIFKQLSERILAYGTEAVCIIENMWGHTADPLIRQRADALIHKIRFSNLCSELVQWDSLGAGNLLLGHLLLARYQFPDLDEDLLRKKIEKLRQEIWLELNDNLTAMEKVRVMNHIIYDIRGFEGLRQGFISPLNSYLNVLMETGKGNQMSMTSLYLILARSLGMPVYGVNLPEHFILAYIHGYSLDMQANPEKSEVLFYINPFNRGAIFPKSEIDHFLSQQKINPQTSYYQPCSNREIIKRMLRNLILSYDNMGHRDKASEYRILLELLR
jgi:regulator of sirC expression with transglutaminase-like and TPR domain